ncbi:MAG: radical SAM protein [bacterium]
MLTLRREESPARPLPPDTTARHPGFHTLEREDAPRTAILRIDDAARLLDPAARRELTDVLTDLARRRRRPAVEIVGIERGDDLVLAATLALFVHFKSARIPVTIVVSPETLSPELLERFERGLAKPALLLKILEQATFARLHYLIGEGDDAGVEAFAPRLPFVELIGDGDPALCRRLARSLDLHKRNLQLMTTRRCHLRCVYCPVEKRDEDLGREHALRGLGLLLASDNSSFRIDFTGGEPLLRKEWVRAVIETAHERALQAGKRDSYYLVTNALELDEEFCRFLSGFEVELEISIDGAEATHNRNKVVVDPGVNPYRALLGNLEHVHRHDIHYNAVLVFTPDSLPALRGNLDHVLSLGFRNISINYAIGYLWPDELIAEYVDVLVDFVERYDMLDSAEGGDAGAGFFLKNLLHKTEPTVLNSELMLDCDGSLHLLSEWQFRERHRRRPPPFRYALEELTSIDEVFFTRAQVYHLLYEVYRAEDRELLRIIHSSVHMGLEVSRRLKRRLGARLEALQRC